MMCTKNIWLQDIHYIRLNYEPNRPLILGGSWKWQHSANICNNQLQKFVWSVPEVSMLIFLWYMYTWYVHVYIHCIPLKMVTRGALGKEHSTINYRSGTWDSTTYCLVLVSWSEKYTSEYVCQKSALFGYVLQRQYKALKKDIIIYIITSLWQLIMCSHT